MSLKYQDEDHIIVRTKREFKKAFQKFTREHLRYKFIRTRTSVVIYFTGYKLRPRNDYMSLYFGNTLVAMLLIKDVRSMGAGDTKM